MKYIVCSFLLSVALYNVAGQTMRWVPLVMAELNGGCPSQTNCNSQTWCYALEYTPAITGTLTSYTTGFFVDCNNLASPVIYNASCILPDNSQEIDGCEEMHLQLVNASANSGAPGISKIHAGVPVILHQVCVQMPEGSRTKITRDLVTGITTSVLPENGSKAISETPEIADYDFKNEIPCPAKPDIILVAVEFTKNTSQLTWYPENDTEGCRFIIEHSTDGVTFSSIGTLDAGNDLNLTTKQGYTYLHESPSIGRNMYRIRQTCREDQQTESEIRVLNIVPNTLRATISPNPASDAFHIQVQSKAGVFRIRLTDISGQLIISDLMETNVNQRLDVSAYASGTYLVVLEAGNEQFVEKLIIVRP